MKKNIILKTCLFILIVSCGDDKNISDSKQNQSKNGGKVFQLVENSGIDFVNRLTPTTALSTFDYNYFQNGGGTAVADFDNDGLQDVYFTSNLESDRLYRNKGDLKFEDITESAGVTGFAHGIKNSWSTGVAIGDVNSDGYPDIYVCKSGAFKTGIVTENLLYVNNRDLTFTERSKEYGVNENNHSTQASFFDYDKDNDLDLFVLNHSDIYGNPNIPYELDKSPDKVADHSCTLYRNDNGKFIDVTKEAGISKFSYGLGLVTTDIDGDGWIDVYVANDFSRPDFMFINNKNGSFTDRAKDATGHYSYYSMGCDIADINNDGMKDISVVDMAPANNFRSKTLMPSMAPEDFNHFVNEFKYPYQYMFNALQVAHGKGKFSEVAKLAGVHKTDWSWSTLLADFDNDGLKDMFVSNGYKFNRMENDFTTRFRAMVKSHNNNVPEPVKQKWINEPPSYKLSNYIFKNENGLEFSKQSKNWGLDKKSFSNGSAYADLDNDGDLDLLINNIDDPAFVYENLSKNNYLQVVLKAGTKWNPSLNLNTNVEIRYNNKIQVIESTLTRGYQGSVEDIIHFGLGNVKTVDTLIVTWKDGRTVMETNVDANQRLVIDKTKSVSTKPTKPSKAKLFVKQDQKGIDFQHKENKYDDFEKELLLPHKNSQHGPFITKADINGDNLEDIFIGGAKGQAGKLFLQTTAGNFKSAPSGPWQKDLGCEDMQAHFFDADGDKDLDLYVVSGGNEFTIKDDNLQDRLYINDGKGSFSKSKNALPELKASGSTVVSFDQDGDGDLDLFVGGRMEPGRYPYASPHYLLINEAGKFSNKIDELAPGINDLGIVTDAIATDFDKDDIQDLIIVGEWTAIHLFKNEKNKLAEVTGANLKNAKGWWSSIKEGDFDNDGDMDFVVGNLGLNYKYKASEKEPFHIYAYDFDNSGSLDIVLGYFNEGVCYPLRGRECSSEQMPFLQEKFPTYKDFATADLKSVYGEDLSKALHREATNFASSILINQGGGNFDIQPLPIEAQFSSINGIEVDDFDKDGNVDLLLAGNLFSSEVETPRNDASIGLFLKGDGRNNFEAIPYSKSGFFANGDVKDIELIQTKTSKLVLIANNNDKLEMFKWMD